MISKNRFWTRLALIASLAALCLVPFWAPRLQAQVISSFLRITSIDVSAFPNVTVSVFGEGLETDLADVELTLQEDGAPQEIITDETREIGVQVSLVIDASANIATAGTTGKSRLEEVADAVADLTKSARLLDGKDYLNAIAFGREGEEPVPQVLAPWSLDHQGVINQILALQPDPANVRTPLIQQIFFALDQFEDANVPGNLQRHIVVFSDGVDLLSGTQPEDLPRRARELDVRVHTVWFRNNAPGAAANIRRIALLTGGESFTITPEEPIPTPIWELIQASQRQRVLTYRTQNPNPEQVTVAAVSASGARLVAERTFPALRVLPAAVQVLEPGPEVIIRSGPAWDTPIEELTPATLPGLIEITWPDGRSRAISSIEYLLDGRTLEGVQVTPQENRLNLLLPIESLDEGSHTFRVRVTDELGLVGESAPVNIQVAVDRPAPPPTPDADATATAMAATVEAQQAIAQATADARATAAAQQIQEVKEESETQVRNLSYVSLVSTTLGLVALIFAVIAWRNPRVRKRATEIVTGAYQAVTEPFFGPRGGGPPVSRAQAQLVLVSGDPSLSPSIDIYKEVTKIGRDPALADVVLNDRRVSRYHCKIVLERDGFRLYDEGSTSGTWVNDRQVEMAGVLLRSGDEINFGPVRYRFVQTGAEPTMTGYTPGVDMPTEQYIPGAPGAMPTQADTRTDYDATQIDLSQLDRAELDSTRYRTPDQDDEDNRTRY